jgi:hypothetical protein
MSPLDAPGALLVKANMLRSPVKLYPLLLRAQKPAVGKEGMKLALEISRSHIVNAAATFAEITKDAEPVFFFLAVIGEANYALGCSYFGEVLRKFRVVLEGSVAVASMTALPKFVESCSVPAVLF